MKSNRSKTHYKRFVSLDCRYFVNSRILIMLLTCLTIFTSSSTLGTHAQSGDTEYMPWVKQKRVAEINYDCRWPHTPGQTLYITYKWGSNLQGSSLWRTAFEQALLEWNTHPIRPFFTFSNSGNLEINTYSIQDGRLGYGDPNCSGSTTISYQVKGNVFYEPYSSGYRRWLATHELGHGMSMGHIPGCDAITMMSYCQTDRNTNYTPAADDIEFINQFYP